MELILYYVHDCLLCKSATLEGSVRAEEPGLNEVKEAAEAVPSESVHMKRKSNYRSNFKKAQKEALKIEGFLNYHY